MLIKYLKCPDGTKLFSFYRHDYKQHEDSFIDGGFDYFRYGNGELIHSDVSTVINDIREQFYWGVNYDKDGIQLPTTIPTLLKDLETSHIINILDYKINSMGTDNMNQNLIILDIFVNELKLRHEQIS